MCVGSFRVKSVSASVHRRAFGRIFGLVCVCVADRPVLRIGISIYLSLKTRHRAGRIGGPVWDSFDQPIEYRSENTSALIKY